MNSFVKHIQLEKQYEDDTFMTYNGTVESLLHFYERINHCHNRLDVTIHSDIEQINFLDIFMKREGDSLVTDLCWKETDKCSFLHGESFQLKKKVFPPVGSAELDEYAPNRFWETSRWARILIQDGRL